MVMDHFQGDNCQDLIVFFLDILQVGTWKVWSDNLISSFTVWNTNCQLADLWCQGSTPHEFQRSKAPALPNFPHAVITDKVCELGVISPILALNFFMTSNLLLFSKLASIPWQGKSIHTMCGVRSVVMFCFVFFLKFWSPIGLHSSCCIRPMTSGTYQKCFTKYHDWPDAIQCSLRERLFICCACQIASSDRITE